MAIAKSASLIPTLLLLILLCFNSGGTLKMANGQSKTWCVAKPSASNEELAANIHFACDQVKDQCNVIQPGGPCFNPNTALNHASVAMNLYYQAYQRNSWNCDFIGSGLISTSDPSYGNCKYA